jgi:EmrB/QacA subfamily drug resistance transporter
MFSHRSARRILLALLSLAQLMVILDISAVNVALPTLSRDLGIAHGDLAWTITSYSLLFGSLLLLGGRAADLLGRRRTFLTGLTLFTVASLAAALAPSAGALYAARATQGIGAALLSPSALSIITITFVSGRERAVALGVWGAVGGAGAAVGVLLGGILTNWISWRAIFFINVPIGVVVMIGVLRFVSADDERVRWHGLDPRGALLATVSLGVLLEALAGAHDAGWASVRTLGLGAAALIGLGAFALLERHTARPLLRVERFADRAITGGFLSMLLAAAILVGSFLLTSVYLQEVLGASPLETGVAFLPIAVAAGAGAHIGSQLVRRVGVRALMAAAFALAGVGTLLLSRLGGTGSYAGDILPGMLLAGFGLGLALVSATVTVLSAAGEDDAGMLSSLTTTGHEIGGALGLATLTTIAAQTFGTAGGAPGHAALAAGLGHAFLAAAVLAGSGLLLALVLLPAAGQFLPRLREAPRPIALH